MVSLTVRTNRTGPIRGRHPWVFSGALLNIPEGLAGGTPVALVDEQGNFLAQGYFNSYSQIAVRVWSWDKTEEVTEEFFVRRVEQAFEIRKKYVASKLTDSYRLIHGENDLLPGLIVDKYGSYLSLQFHNPGIEQWREQIVAALVKVVKPKGIYERSDVRDRTRQFVIASEAKQSPSRSANSVSSFDSENKGIAASADANRLPRNDKVNRTGLLYGEVPEKVKILENGYKFWVDIIGGQKTGFFLDQRDKRQALTKYVEGKKVLNCFSYTGGFSVYALGADAKQVVSVDASENALKLAEENVKLNRGRDAINRVSTRTEFILADVKEYLGDLASAPQGKATPPHPPLGKGRGRSYPLLSKEGRGVVAEASPFDIIILDPPAFIKDRHKIKEGLSGYRKINEAALRVLP
ncbi:hypothetical protein A2635_03015, partial [Candidatus Peribacteria bacterium RIFCSPHIGHO2_01_FULL_51_9]